MSREPLFLRGASEDPDYCAQKETPKFTTKDMKNLLNEQKRSICEEISHMIKRRTNTATSDESEYIAQQQTESEDLKKEIKHLFSEQRAGIRQDVSGMIKRQKRTSQVQSEIDNLREVLRGEITDQQLKTKSDRDILRLAIETIESHKNLRRRHRKALRDIDEIEERVEELKIDREKFAKGAKDLLEDVTLLESMLGRQGYANHARRVLERR